MHIFLVRIWCSVCIIWTELCVVCGLCGHFKVGLSPCCRCRMERYGAQWSPHTHTHIVTVTLPTSQITETTQSLWVFLKPNQKTWTRLFPWLKGWDDYDSVAIETLQMTKYCQWIIHHKVLQQMFLDQGIVVVKLLMGVLTFLLVH